MISQEELSEIRSIIDGILQLMGLSLKSSVFSRNKEIQINLSGNDRAYLITDNGETLLSLQYIVGKMIRQKLPVAGEFRILLDSDGYMFRHEQGLKRLAVRTMERVRIEGRRIKLPAMNPYDRRIIHSEVARTGDLHSASEGEGFFKKVIVQRRNDR